MLAAAQLEAQRMDLARQDALKQELATQEVQRLEVMRQEVARQDVARVAATQLEAQRLDRARQEALKQDLAKQEAQRQETLRLEASRQEAARLDAARQEAAKLAAAQLEKQRLADLPVEKPRRRTLLGRPDQDVRLAMFAEAWSQWVQQNADFEVLNAAKTGTYTNPIVSVTLRADGAVDSIEFKRATGIPELDEAVRKVILSLAPYRRFPSELAMEYDLVELSRLWTFGSGVRLVKVGR